MNASRQTATNASSKSAKPAARTPAPAPGSHTAESTPSLASIRRSLTGGAPLPPTTSERMQAGFGRSFSDVRVHTGGAADSAARSLHAEAFTSGTDIAFAQGRYRPGTEAGDQLIAHELAHVVQQGGSGGTVQAKTALSIPGDSAEAAADAAAAAVVSGRRANVAAGGLSLRGRIMRRARAGPAPRRSTVLSQAPPRPGGVAPGSGPVLTPTMTSTVSPAGGALTGVTKGGEGRPEAASKTPDEAQTPAGEATDGGRSPVDVMVAGAPAGASEDPAAATQAANGNAAEKHGQKKAEQDKKEKKDVEGGVAEGAGEGRAQPGGTRRFGRNLGDRGAGAAREARRRLTERSTAMQANEGAGTRIGAARAAANPPANAANAAGQQAHADTLQNAEVPPPDTAGASARAEQTVEGSAPSTIEDLENFAGPRGASARARIGDSIAADAAAQTGPVQQSMSAVSSPPQGPQPPSALPQPEPVAAPGSPDPALAAATPPAVPEESLDASEFQADADEALAEHEVDDETLGRAEEGPLRAIGNDKNELNDNVAGAADRARGRETAARDAAQSTLAVASTGAAGGMAGERVTGQTSVSAEQDTTRSGEEAGQQTLADRINQIYLAAEQEVTGKLSSLQTDSIERFRTQQSARVEAFASGVRSDLEAFKRRRYSGFGSTARRIRDWLLSINSLREVKELYERHRNQYIRDIDGLLSEIRADIDRTVTECKATLAAAKTEIDTFVAESGQTLDAEAQAALDRATQQFAAMERRIESTAQQARQALNRERERAIAEMDRALAEIQAENAGLVDRIANAIRALAEALGRFMALMTRITRMGIGTFLGAALGQAKDGVENHLWDQLKEAFKQWIFMKLPGLQILLNLPTNWAEMLTAMATSMIGLFTENIPAMLPAIGAAAMIWLATALAAKLIPGVGAIMAVIDAIRGAWALVQSLFTAAQAFFQFLMRVAERGNGAVAFARALAFGIVAAVDAILTFLGVDRLIRRVVGAIARPFGRIVRRLQTRFQQFMARRRRGRQRSRTNDRRARGRDSDGRRRAGDHDRRRRREARRARQRRRAGRAHRRRSTNSAGRRRDRQRDRNDNRRRQDDRQRRERERRRRRRAIRQTRARLRALARRDVSLNRLRAEVAVLRARHRWRSLTVRKSGSKVEFRGSMSPEFEVLEIGEHYQIVRVKGTRPLDRTSGETFEQGAVGFSMRQMLPAMVPEGLGPLTQAGSRRRGSRILHSLPLPRQGDPAHVRREPIIAEPGGGDGSRAGSFLPELLVARHSEVILVEATLQTDWTVGGNVSTASGMKLRKRAQLEGFIWNIASKIGRTRRRGTRITVVFIAPSRPQGRTLDAIRQNLSRHAPGMQVEIRWLVVPSV